MLTWVSTWRQRSGSRAGQRGSTRTSVHSDRPTGAWASEDARAKVSHRGAWLRPSDRLPTDLGGARVRPRGSSWPTLVWAQDYMKSPSMKIHKECLKTPYARRDRDGRLAPLGAFWRWLGAPSARWGLLPPVGGRQAPGARGWRLAPLCVRAHA
ncbi:hypothetical protein TIFTF001_033865 [Ficus carica]|uniref:Uncharacterized protein n=1 Tax=Ficus carica TaxID=3494 RepID=A0AA88DYY6_FICCA|nr:hypothetical protein TIFTF001_033865 [Ficus carica]